MLYVLFKYLCTCRQNKKMCLFIWLDRMEELIRGLRGPPGLPGLGKPGRQGRPGAQGIPGRIQETKLLLKNQIDFFSVLQYLSLIIGISRYFGVARWKLNVFLLRQCKKYQ